MGLPRIVSLFSGAGGLDLGFVQAGFKVAFASDLAPSAIDTHKWNFPNTRSTVADLTELGADGLLRSLASILVPGESIGVIGGPPCQGFSRANAGRGAGDPRNELPIVYLKMVEAMQARYDVKFVLFENVLGIKDAKHEKTFETILAKFRSLGLEPHVAEHNAADYGVPQNRKRVIISAFKSSVAATAFIPKKAGDTTTVREAIYKLPEPAFFSRRLAADEIPHHPNHWTMQPRSARFANGTSTPGTRSFKRLQWDEPSPTVAYGHREIHVHPEGHRRLSVFEAMLLQGFPASFVLHGTLSDQVQQISNAVPPPMARAMATGVKVALQDGQ